MSSANEASRIGHLPTTLMRTKFVACQKCHARKVRCPGGNPCQACVQINCEPDCVYPKRDRQIKISQSYLEGLLQENKLLRARLHSERPEVEEQAQAEEGGGKQRDPERATSDDEASIEEPSQNPLLHERPWFLPIQSSKMPIWIGEVADAAFATRFRQVLLNAETNHIPRINYPSDEDIILRADPKDRQLSSAQAHFLLQTTLAHLQGHYHIVRRSAIKGLLDQYLREPRSLDLISRSKLYAIFALGELYSSRFRGPEQDAPGLDFFRNATQGYGRLQERPSVDCTEALLLLSLYSLCINRRHSAYILSSSAIRHCIVLGLHFNLPSSQVPEPAEREHLKRVWWTAYMIDYSCAAISSLLLSTRDDEIYTDLPARIQRNENNDFEGTDLLTARIHLATQGRNILRSIYGRTNAEPFVQRVQRALRDLKLWLQKLPENLRMHSDETCPKDQRVTSLHLFFNQCLILATRPVLLYVLSIHTSENRSRDSVEINKGSENTRTLAETCIRCARHSFGMINDSWINGSFGSFDYFHTQYLFSAATILGISSLLGKSHAAKDGENFELAGQLLERLQEYGSFSAMELYRHFNAVKIAMDTSCSESRTIFPPIMTPAEADIAEDSGGTISLSREGAHSPFQPHVTSTMTSGMALLEPSFEAFLTASEPNLDGMEFAFDGAQQENVFWFTM